MTKWLVRGVAVGLTWAAVVAAHLPEVNQDRRLARDGAVATGRIVEIAPQEHQRAVYTFAAAGRTFEGRTLGYSGGVGDDVKVYYLPTDPTVSTIFSPAASWRATLKYAAFLGVLLGVAMAYAVERGPFARRGQTESTQH